MFFTDQSSEQGGEGAVTLVFTSGASGAVPTTLTRSLGITSVEYAATGQYTVVFQNPCNADLFFGGDVQQASYSASGACALSRRSTTITNGIATVVFVTVTAAGAAVAAASGDIITARFVFAATAEGYGVQV